jgi:cytochrome c oxidase assembly protein subunit 15
MRLPRLSPAAYRRITFFALVALAGIVLTGAAVRLTGSGLGCSDWPTCEQGQLAPSEISDAPAMIEFVNRMITGVVSVAVIVAVLGSLARVPRRRDLTWLSVGLVGGVLAQILIGAAVVLLELSPRVVMVHFLVSMVLVANAAVLHHRAGEPDGSRRPVVAPVIRSLGRLLLGAATLVLLLGSVVTASGPHAGDEQAERLDLAVGEVARVHGIAVLLLLTLTLVILWVLHKEGAPPEVHAAARTLLAVEVAQGAVGYAQYFSGVPAWLVAIHIVGAIAVWLAAIRFNLVLACPSDDARRGRATGRGRGHADGRPVDRPGVERPDQPDVLRDLRVPEAVRVQPREGDVAHAGRSREGAGGRGERDA